MPRKMLSQNEVDEEIPWIASYCLGLCFRTLPAAVIAALMVLLLSISPARAITAFKSRLSSFGLKEPEVKRTT